MARRNKPKTKSNSEKNVSRNSKSVSYNRKEGETSRRGIKEEEKSGNDPAWYASNPVILKDAASYPFSYSTGATEIHDQSVWGANSNVESAPLDQIPGICSLHVYPAIGTASNATDPINVAAQSVYSFVRHANSGHSNYDPCDLMMYILAMANMYSYLVFCQRAYGYALTYDQRNRYLPKDLLRTNNIDASDLVSNLANFRFWINTLIAKMVSFAVPATMSIFSRMSFIYSDYYIEGTSIKEQLYQYVPEGFYQFDLDTDQKGILVWKPFDYSTPMKTADIMQYGDNLFNAIWSQEDFGIMSGDILKAYGGNIIKLVSLPEYYTIVPKFDAMVLTQMKNADLVRLTTARISQDPTTGNIVQILTPEGITSTDTYYGDSRSVDTAKTNAVMVSTLKDYHILTVDTDDPTPDVVIEATRLKVAYDAVKGWYKVGTEVITKCVLTIEPGSDMDVLPYIITDFDQSSRVSQSTQTAQQHLLEAARNFHYVPRFWLFNFNQMSNKYIVSQVLDVDNFTLLSYEDVRKLHEAATINMFAVPSVGKVQ